MASEAHSAPIMDPEAGTQSRPGLGRWIATAALSITAVVHLILLPDQLHEASYMAVMFLGFSAIALAVAVALALRDSYLAWLAALVISLAALLAYTLSRTTGLPLMPDDVGDWGNPLGLIAVLAETTTLVLALPVARLPRHH